MERLVLGAAMTAQDNEVRRFEQILQALPVAVYTTDTAGNVAFYNAAAVALWGERPEIGQSQVSDSWRLCWPGGGPVLHDECPAAIALREKRAIDSQELEVERPDGTRVPFLAYATPYV